MNIQISPDSQSGLDQSCDSNSGENGSDQLTDCVLVSPDAHGLSQKKRHSNGAAETRQVMLRTSQVTATLVS